MFFRLLLESFRRQRRRKLLAGIAILLGTTAVTAMLALATTIGDRIHQELAVYGANIVITPKAAGLDVKVGGIDIKPATGGAYLKESDLPKLKTIFWGNNITGISPELPLNMEVVKGFKGTPLQVIAKGYWFNRDFGTIKTGANILHPWWKLEGNWPRHFPPKEGPSDGLDVAVGSSLAKKLGLKLGDFINFDPNATEAPSPAPQFKVGVVHPGMEVVGIVTTDADEDNQLFLTLPDAQLELFGLSVGNKGAPDAISRVEVSATTKPEDAFARVDPATLSPAQHEIWYCRPYANSIAYQIREAMPDADAQQVRRVEQSEGTVLARISGLMWLISAAALLAAGFAVSAAMATAVLERRHEIGLMRSLGASKGAIALLFYAETALLAIFAGTLGYLIGSGLAAWLGARIFAGESIVAEHILIPVLLPVIVGTALVVAMAGSTPSIRAALRLDPSAVLRGDV
jgi:putative ABC transport system permease protein